eukprot:g41634.t1
MQARSQLSDTSSYRPLDHDPTSDHQAIISQTINNLITSGDLPTTASNLIEMGTAGLPSTDTFICLVELDLTLNKFSFDSSHFLQTKGVAMGTCTGPSYACLFVGFVEQFFFNDYAGTIPHLFFRYIDDCIGGALCFCEELKQFTKFDNSFHRAIKFTWTISDTSLRFLDLSISIS